MKKSTSERKKATQKVSIGQDWSVINTNAAGIDLGSREHWVAVPAGRAAENVRRFGTTTPELEAMAEWFKQCQVTHVAMEATGVYWIAVYQLLERRGLQVLLVNARQIKNVSGRKSDMLDCQWIQRLHTYGLLGGSFRPADAYCVVRSLVRYREELIAGRTTQVQHMQKALLQMNLQLRVVLSDICGESGLAIIEAILKGQRDPVTLASLAHRRVKSSRQEIAQALVGDYRSEHLFVLKMGWELYHNYQDKINQCELAVAEALERLPERANLQERPLPDKPKGKKIDEALRQSLYRKVGVDLTAIESVGTTVALTVITEVGPELTRFATEKHFCSWLGLSPEHRITGGKILSSHTRRVVNRLSDALRLAASCLEHSAGALGGYYRRMKRKLGAPQAITATAHKLARIIYRMLKYGEAYVRQGLEDYERKTREESIRRLKRAATAMGYDLTERQPLAQVVS
ncbi:MAG: IS110 family transposase [Methylococcaceae bacterium]|nr:IS110 family transposase [Methylococcaceae bacterium]